MPLTKVRPPVTAITKVENTTSSIEIASAAGTIDINVAGLDVADIATTTFTLDDLVTLVANTITSENISASTVAGAAMQFLTDSAEGAVRTTSAHPLVLGANTGDHLTVETTGRVTLANVGTAASELVDKNYVDNTVTGATGTGGAAAPAAVMAQNGSIVIPTNQATDLIIKWGKVTDLSPGVNKVVTYPTAFPNATFIALCTNYNSGSGTQANSTVIGNQPSATQVTFVHGTGAGSLNPNLAWLAIGH